MKEEQFGNSPESQNTAPVSIFGLLNRIYSSTLLSNRLKHYFACRVLCLGYRAVSASILLYDGGKEKLVSKGIYLHRNGIKLHHREKKLLKSAARTEILEKYHIVRYLGFYHFLFSKFISTSLPKKVTNKQAFLLSEYFKSKKYLSYDFPEKVDIIDRAANLKTISTNNKNDVIKFVQFCIENSRRHATNESGLLDVVTKTKYYYQLNKELITAEEYEVGSKVDTYSGRIYHNLSSKGAIRDYDNLIIQTEDDFGKPNKPAKPNSTRNKIHNIKTKLAKVGLEFRSHKHHYVGVPLIANGRCIGILRLFFAIEKIKERSPKAGLLYSKNGEEVKKFLTEKENERNLLYSVEILGNLLDQTYPKAFMEGIPRDSDFMKNLGNEDKDESFNEWCTSLQKAINCYGCMLRFTETSLTGPARKGCSDNIKAYVSYMQVHPKIQFIIKDGKFHRELMSIFPNVNIESKNRALNFVHDAKFKKNQIRYKGDNKRIVAVLIDFGENYKEIRVLRYYYCIGNQEEVRPINKIASLGVSNLKELRLVNSIKPQDSFITKEYHNIFTGKKQISSSAKKNIAIHKGRYLLLIDMPSQDVAGVASFSNSVNRRFSLSDVRIAYGQVKQLGVSISQMNITSLQVAIANSLHSIKCLRYQLEQLIKTAKLNNLPSDKIDKFKIAFNKYKRRLASLEKSFGSGGNYLNKLSRSEKKLYDLINYLKKRIDKEYKVEAESKNIYIDIHHTGLENIMTSVNKECLWLCLEGILENAIERTHKGSIMLNRNSHFFVAGFKENTPMVPGNIKVELKKLIDAVEISITNYGSSISKDQVKYMNQWDYSPKNKEGNRGFGLHLVRLFLLLINCEWIPPVPTPNNATFKLKIKI